MRPKSGKTLKPSASPTCSAESDLLHQKQKEIGQSQSQGVCVTVFDLELSVQSTSAIALRCISLHVLYAVALHVLGVCTGLFRMHKQISKKGA